MSVRALDDFYSVIHSEIANVLATEGLPDTPPAYWVVLNEASGALCKRLFESSVEPTEALRRLADENPNGVALVSYVEPEGAMCFLAYASMRAVEDSDVRRAEIRRDDDELRLGPWSRTA